MPKARRASRPSPSRRAARASVSAPPPPTPRGPVTLLADPTGHAVCRSCGRIVRLALSPLDGPNLEAFADRRPDGWSAEAVSLSVTGVCANCRAGAPARR